ncbi:MAG: GNAT family N-acetyltransferase [Anaerolineales bacterium]
MIQSEKTISIRPVVEKDKKLLANLIHFETHVHRHLDWRAPLEWVGFSPCLVAEQNGKLVATLVSPPDPPEIAWIRLFAVSAEVDIEDAWNLLWPAARAWLSQTPEMVIAAIPLQQWFHTLLETSGFQHVTDVKMLLWEHGNRIPLITEHSWLLRTMNQDDLSVVEKLDEAAFGPLWRNSLESLKLAFQQAAVATVAEDDDGLVGYQISTASPMGGHLARLAVDPEQQGKGIGFSLVLDTISQFKRRGAQRVTVNTQQDNHASLSLYLKAGFRETSEQYPVYLYQIE